MKYNGKYINLIDFLVFYKAKAIYINYDQSIQFKNVITSSNLC